MPRTHRSTRKNGTRPIAVGDRFERLTVLEGPVRVSQPSKANPSRTIEGFVFQCDCGNRCVANKYAVLRGYTRSCGCLRREAERENGKRSLRHGYARHVVGRSPEYAVWTSLRNRCSNPRHHAWKDYGGRGITVCERWQHSFEAFLGDMGPRPTAAHQIDRIDNDGPYSKDNCRWATVREQARNRRSCVYLEYGGKLLTQSEWSEITGIAVSTLISRRDRGWTTTETLSTPPGHPRKID